jgi:hypothetical protein
VKENNDGRSFTSIEKPSAPLQNGLDGRRIRLWKYINIYESVSSLAIHVSGGSPVLEPDPLTVIMKKGRFLRHCAMQGD